MISIEEEIEDITVDFILNPEEDIELYFEERIDLYCMEQYKEIHQVISMIASKRILGLKETNPELFL